MKSVTIKDVAKYANVSPSTVSRVISNHPRISSETKKKVREAMKKLGYHHNAIARSLVKQRANSIGLVMARSTQEAFANPFFHEIIQGIALAAQDEHFSLTLSATRDYQEEREETLRLLRNKRVDGLILLASRVNDELIKDLKENNYPFVLIGRSMEIDDLPMVDIDNIKAAYQTIKFLTVRGYSKIAFICGPKDYVVTQDRLKGIKLAMKDCKLQYNESVVKYSNFTFEGGVEATLELVKEHEIDSIFAFDDMMAFGALRAAQKLGYNIPEDIGIIGFNDAPMISYIQPALSTVSAPVLKIGLEAGKMLIKMITDKSYTGEKIIIPTKIIARESTRFPLNLK